MGAHGSLNCGDFLLFHVVAGFALEKRIHTHIPAYHLGSRQFIWLAVWGTDPLLTPHIAKPPIKLSTTPFASHIWFPASLSGET